MTLLQALFHVTNFKNPLLRSLVPCISVAFAMQAAFGLPSVIARSDRFYDFSGALTHLSVTALSLYLPSLRARYTTAGSTAGFPSLIAPFTNPAGAALNWRQVVISTAVAIWATRLGSYLFQRVLREGKDSRFDEMKKAPPKFFAAFMAQATWVSLCVMPLIVLNAAPAAAFAALPAGVRITDVLGLALFVSGFGFEVVADRQKARWMAEKKQKIHDEDFVTRGLWSTSQYPNYFGESVLWTGIATFAAGALVTKPIQAALGLSGGIAGRLGVLSLAYVSPAFTMLALLKLSGVPLSEKKYDRRYGHRKDYQEWKKNTPKFIPKLF